LKSRADKIQAHGLRQMGQMNTDFNSVNRIKTDLFLIEAKNPSYCEAILSVFIRKTSGIRVLVFSILN
jgi:hypothetical protein